MMQHTKTERRGCAECPGSLDGRASWPLPMLGWRVEDNGMDSKRKPGRLLKCKARRVHKPHTLGNAWGLCP